MWSRSWSVALASLVLLVGCGSSDGEASAPEAERADSGTSTPADAAPTRLSMPAAQSGRCMPPSVDSLRAQDTAFEGTVTGVVGEVVTLQVDEMYAGQEVDTVEVDVPDQGMTDLVLAVDFEQGQTYLISSLDGQLSVCGLSGPKDDLLTGLYDEAYAG